MNKQLKYKLGWIIIGSISVIWFLIRVIPKPSRASYPCQRAAFPIASSFVIWLLSLMASVKMFIKAKSLIKTNRWIALVLFLIVAISFSITGVNYKNIQANSSLKNNNDVFVPIDEPNTPMGNSFGIFPGRVVWYHNPEATCWDGRNGYFWENKNTNSNEVNKMLAESVDAISGATSNWDAWKMLFVDFNKRKRGEERGYSEGEKVAIKLNLSNSDTHGEIYDNHSLTTPQLVIALVRQLVNEAEIPASCITLYDISQKIPDVIYETCHSEFQELHFVDEKGGEGRIKYETDSTVQLMWSKDLVLEEGGGNPTYIPKCITQADYIINLAILKGHDMAGITLCAKNHVGSIISTNPERPELTSPRAAGIHPYATVHDFSYWNLPERPMGSYNVLVDLMGHKDLGDKSLLFIVDGLYASKAQNGKASEPRKWFMSPFNNDWTSSIFISQDNVALESVCLDFLRSEPTMVNVYGSVDNYLHEAALANDPPSGMAYNPERDSTKLLSLGVHEHWNNAADKTYTGNIIQGLGIELIKLNNYKVGDLSFNQLPGEYNDILSLKIETSTIGADIFYTTDGSYPDTNSNLYEDVIEIESSMLINARGFKKGYEPSEILTGEFLINTTGINIDESEVKIAIYPSICQDKIHIKSQDYNQGVVKLSVYDIKGSCVLENLWIKDHSVSMHDINIINLPNGFYLVKVLFNGKVKTQKIYKSGN